MNNKTLTIPNILSIFRLILVPIFIWSYFYVNNILALTIFLLAGFTDVLDGYLARKLNAISDIGKVLDPLADKTMRLTVIASFVISNILPLWVLIVMLIIDLMLIISSAVLFKKKYVVSSNGFGKVAEFSLIFALALCFFSASIRPYNLFAIYLSIGLVFVSVVIYGLEVFQNYKKINLK